MSSFTANTIIPALIMDQQPQGSDAVVAGAHTTDKQEAPAGEILRSVQRVFPRPKIHQYKDTLDGMLETYFTKFIKINGLLSTHSSLRSRIKEAERNIKLYHQHNMTSNLQILDLDELSTLDDHNHLLALSKGCLELQVQYNAQERVIYAKLNEMIALKARITTYHGPLLEERDPSIQAYYAAKTNHISWVRLSHLGLNWKRVRRGY